MKTFIKVILIVAAGMAVVAGCAKKSQITDLQDQIDALKSDQIQTIAGQISAISASLTSLQNTDTQLKAYIETLQGQASNLETTSKSLEDAIAKLKEDLTNEITTAKSEVLKQLETLKASIDVELKTLKDTIENLQKKDEDLQTQIDELKKYAETELKNAKDWATATFATLEQYNKTAEIVAGIQGQIETINDELVNAKKYTDDVKAELDNAIASLKTDLQAEIKDAADAAAQALTIASEEVKKAYTETIEAAITASETSIKTWVNEQLSAYYTAELMDSKLEALQTALENKQNSQDENLKNLISTLEKDVNAEIADLKQALADQKADIETAYTKAIRDAIKANNGTIDQKITDALKPVTESLTALRTRLGNLQTIVKALTDRVKAIEEGLKSLTSIAYIPKYSDNKERVRYEVSGTKYITPDLNLSFDVYPADCADNIVTAYNKWRENNSAGEETSSPLSARAVYTLTKATAGDFVNLSVSNVTSSDGILTVTVSPDGLDEDFFDGKYEASLVLKISTGYNNIQSDYIGLVPVRELSLFESANCYLVQAAGDYEFKAVQGNTFKKGDSGKTGTSVGTVASVGVLWESFGTATAPKTGDLIASATYSDGYIQFSTPADFKQGNAVIAAKDASGTILWSWHIWCAKEGWKEQEYYNNAGTMMDRNLGATTATAGEVGSLGLLYQWGRKDPFLGSSSVSTSTKAASTGTWNTRSESVTENSTKNPTTFYTGFSNYMPDGSWASTKTVYDPCPSGWRVPDGGTSGVWATGSTITSGSYGLNFGGVFGSAETIWYPASGCLYYVDGGLFLVGFRGHYWSVTPNPSGNNFAYYLYFSRIGTVELSDNSYRSIGGAVRCLQE